MRRWVDWLLEQPLVYRAWQAPFADSKFEPVQRHLSNTTIGRILDVGCGPGTNAPRFSQSDYTGIDINEQYLSRARSKHKGRFIQADLMTADLTGLGQFDVILVNSFLHHLPDRSVDRILAQLASLLHPGGSIHVLELVMPAGYSLARLMARLDRGRYARSVAAWEEHMRRHFDPVVVEPYWLGGGLWAMVYFQGKARCDSR